VRLGSNAAGMRLSRSGDALWVLTREPAQLTEVRLDSCARRAASSRRVPDALDLAVQTEDALIVSRSGTRLLSPHSPRASDAGCPHGVEPSIACFRKDGKQLIAGSEADAASRFATQPPDVRGAAAPLH